MSATDDREQLRALLARTPLFRGLGANEMDRLSPRFTLREAPAGAVIVEQHAPGDELFLVEAGELAASISHDGATARLGVLRAGDVFGEMALLRGTPRTATVTALTPVRLWALSRAALDEAMRQAPAIGARLRAIMRRRDLANAFRALQ
ncbi:MAG: cyclic nucleotide-binding domain-containing protein [Thermomicrobiales bacterium]